MFYTLQKAPRAKAYIGADATGTCRVSVSTQPKKRLRSSSGLVTGQT